MVFVDHYQTLNEATQIQQKGENCSELEPEWICILSLCLVFFEVPSTSTMYKNLSPPKLVPPIPLNRLKFNLGQLNTTGIVLQLALYFISRLYLTSARGRTGNYHITYLEKKGERSGT